MSEVISFKEKQLQEFAKKFVDVYEAEGKIAAAQLARAELANEHKPRARVLIREELFMRGYDIIGEE